VILDGSASTPVGEIGWVWSFVEYPGAIAPVWVDNTDPTPTFLALQEGLYVVQLVVATLDPVLFSLPDFVEILVIDEVPVVGP
jgi:hypothetical protein